MGQINLNIKDEDLRVLHSRAEAQGFENVELYLMDLVKQVVAQIHTETPEADADDIKSQEPVEDPDQAAKDVLKDLGYI